MSQVVTNVTSCDQATVSDIIHAVHLRGGRGELAGEEGLRAVPGGALHQMELAVLAERHGRGPKCKQDHFSMLASPRPQRDTYEMQSN